MGMGFIQSRELAAARCENGTSRHRIIANSQVVADKYNRKIDLGKYNSLADALAMTALLGVGGIGGIFARSAIAVAAAALI
jgi:hypothetical protein